MKGLPWWLRWQSGCLQCGRPGFDPCVGKIPWRRQWQPTLVLLPGKSHGWRSLVGHSPWGKSRHDSETSPSQLVTDLGFESMLDSKIYAIIILSQCLPGRRDDTRGNKNSRQQNMFAVYVSQNTEVNIIQRLLILVTTRDLFECVCFESQIKIKRLLISLIYSFLEFYTSRSGEQEIPRISHSPK